MADNTIKRPFLRKGIMVNPPPTKTSQAAGYWGAGSPKDVMLADQTVERIIKSNSDWVKMGVAADVWVSSSQFGGDNLPVCSCVKVTNQSGDIRCNKCQGLKKVPGYVKWGFNTCFFSAVDVGLTGQQDSGYNLPATIVKNTSTTLHTLQLANGVLSAQFETKDFNVFNPYSKFFELHTNIYNRGPGNSYFVEWSIDRGTSWISDRFESLILSTGAVRFRITLSRISGNSPSPQFEILRFRHPIQEYTYIKVAKPMGRRKRSREEWGKVENESGIKYITVPLKGSAQVNGQIVYDKPWLPESDVIIEIKEGTFAGDKYWITEVERSEHIGVMTSQYLSVRRIQNDESYAQVF